jgi:CheY-like chemotaxis protein
LYADDDPNDLFLVQHAFARRRPDVQIRTAANGREAIEYLTSALRHLSSDPIPNLIILDLKMPLQDGFETLLWIRARRRLAGIPVIILSSSDRPTDHQKAADLGATHCITKGCSVFEVPDHIAPWLPSLDAAPGAPLR